MNSHLIPGDAYATWCPTFGPDGTLAACISDRGGEPQVWLPTGGDAPWELLPAPLHRVVTVAADPSGTWLAVTTEAEGSSCHQVWVVRPDGSELRLLAGGAALTAALGGGPWHGWSADGRVMLTETGEASTALLADPANGERDVVALESLLWLVDVHGALALLRRGGRGARTLAVLDRADGTRTPLDTGHRPGSDDEGFFAADGRSVLVRTDVGRDRAALVSAAPHLAPRVLASRPDGELQALAVAPDRRTAGLLWNVRGGISALSTWDLTAQRENAVGNLPRPVLDDIRLDSAGRRLLFTGVSWSDPRGVWSAELPDGAFSYLSSRNTPVVLGSPGAAPHTVRTSDLTQPRLLEFLSRDGLPLSGWLYAPPTPGPWPSVVYLHGGPEAQERPVYNSLFQGLVAEGVAVLAANFRGSSGFGRSFRTSDNLAGRFGAINDVADCVDHLVQSGCARAGSTGVMGRSYGGYLTLAALVTFPELFAVGVDVCGMADFATFYRDTEPWIARAAIPKYGDPFSDSDLLHALSPIHRIDRIRAPLLVVHGANDTNVPLGEAHQVVQALDKLGAPHEFLLFPDEGHELFGTTNRVVFVRRVIDWVTRHLMPGPAGPTRVG